MKNETMTPIRAYLVAVVSAAVLTLAADSAATQGQDGRDLPNPRASTRKRTATPTRGGRTSGPLLAQATPQDKDNGGIGTPQDAGNADGAAADGAAADGAAADGAAADGAAGDGAAGDGAAGDGAAADGAADDGAAADKSGAGGGDQIIRGDPSLRGQRVDITPGQIPVEEFMRFLADYNEKGLPVIFASGTTAGASSRTAQTINITAPIKNADYHIVKAILDANGFQVLIRELENGQEIITIRSTSGAQQSGEIKETKVIDVEGGGAHLQDSELSAENLGVAPDELATMVFTLEHVAPQDAIQSLNQLVGGPAGGKTPARGSTFTAVEVKGTQTLIVTAKFGLLDYILKLLKIIDVEQHLPKRIVHIIEAKEAEAQQLADIVEQFLQQSQRARTTASRPSTSTGTRTSAGARSSSASSRFGGRNEFETTLIADARTQKIIVTTYEQRDLEDINMLVRELDTRFDIRRLKTQIYRMRYLKAIDVAPVISDIVGSAGGSRSGTRGLGTSARSRNRVPGRAGVSSPTGGAARSGGIGAGGAGAAGLLPTLIVPHEETNSLIVQAEPEDYAEILHILGEIDVKRRQVFLEAALVQVSVQSALNFTIELLAGDPDDRTTRALFEQSFGLTGINTEDFNRIFDLSNPPPGGVLAIMDRGKFPFLVSFLKSQTDTEVLATPFILADDNVQSTINITETRFVQNTQTVNTATTTSQQGEDAGITLDIFPTINSENSVFLETGLEVSEFAQVETANVLPPKTTNQITSSVTIAGDRIYVIGGLTRQSKGRVAEKLPILGDIPFLGKLFRSEGSSQSVTNLYVFLRAHILTDEDFQDLGRLTDQAIAKTEEFGTTIDSEYKLDARPPRSEGTVNPDDPRTIRKSPVDSSRGAYSSSSEDLRRRAGAARDGFRGSDYGGNDPEGRDAHSPAPKTGAPESRSPTEVTPDRGSLEDRVGAGIDNDTLDELGAPRGTTPRDSGTGTRPAPGGALPDSWRRHGLEVDPDGESWFVPLRPKRKTQVSSEE